MIEKTKKKFSPIPRDPAPGGQADPDRRRLVEQEAPREPRARAVAARGPAVERREGDAGRLGLRLVAPPGRLRLDPSEQLPRPGLVAARARQGRPEEVGEQQLGREALAAGRRRGRIQHGPGGGEVAEPVAGLGAEEPGAALEPAPPGRRGPGGERVGLRPRAAHVPRRQLHLEARHLGRRAVDPLGRARRAAAARSAGGAAEGGGRERGGAGQPGRRARLVREERSSDPTGGWPRPSRSSSAPARPARLCGLGGRLSPADPREARRRGHGPAAGAPRPGAHRARAGRLPVDPGAALDGHRAPRPGRAPDGAGAISRVAPPPVAAGAATGGAQARA
jgi:hypothetical protein